MGESLGRIGWGSEDCIEVVKRWESIVLQTEFECGKQANHCPSELVNVLK